MDDLALIWQSAPVHRGGWFGGAESSVEAPRSSDPADDEGDAPLDQLETRICSLASRLAATTHDWLRLIAEFDRRKGWVQWGVKSCSHWLAWACSVTPGVAREYVRVASALVTLPLLDAAFAAGRLSYSKVRAVTRVADRVDEQTLLNQALVHTASQLERLVRGYRKADGAGLDQQRYRRARWFWDDDGMLVLTARLPVDEGAIVVAALEQAQHSILSGAPKVVDDADASSGMTTQEGDDRGSPTAADALVSMAQDALAVGPVDSSGDDRHLLVLHVDSTVLSNNTPTETSVADPSLPCHIENGPGLDRLTARRIACDAAIVATIRSAIPGEELRLGRKTRKISPAQRRALRIRDGGCQFPGCHRRRHIEAHHVLHWLDGGATDLDNLVLLCRRHHMAIHEEGFTVAPSATRSVARRGNHWEFRRPDGVSVPATPILEPPLGERLNQADSFSVLYEASFPLVSELVST